MKKKYKVTMVLIFAVCFYGAMIFGDTLLREYINHSISDKTVTATSTYGDTQDKILESEVDLVQEEMPEQNSDNASLFNQEDLSVKDEETVIVVENSKDDDERELELEAQQNRRLEEELDETELLAVVEEEVSAQREEAKDSTPKDTEYPLVVSKVKESLNIRKEADAEAEIVGKLYVNSYATILERSEEWTKIESGKVIGYASNTYLYFDEDAKQKLSELEAFLVEITAGTVNIRTEAGTDSEILSEAKKGESLPHRKDEDLQGWLAVEYEGETAYVSSEFAKPITNIKTAVTMEEEKAFIRQREIERALLEAKKYKPASTNRTAIKVSDEELFLLATVVAMEAVGEPYEGQLAVANVVINRLISGRWGDTISDVVYAKGQFSGANSGRVERFESRVTESCKRAAVEALAGNNNIGDYMFFIMNNIAKHSNYSKYYVLGCHCFYQR